MKKRILFLVAVSAVLLSSAEVTAQATWNCGEDPGAVTCVFINGTLTVSGTGRIIDFRNSSLISSEAKEGIAKLSTQVTTVIIEEGVTDIGEFAFGQLREQGSWGNLTSVIIPNSVISIGWAAFRENKLTDIIIPNSVRTIEFGAFARNKLTNITIPEGVTSIGVGAFLDNQLTNVTIPNSMRTIEGSAFGQNPIKQITIGTNVEFARSQSNPIKGFVRTYRKNKHAAGLYISDNRGRWRLERQD